MEKLKTKKEIEEAIDDIFIKNESDAMVTQVELPKGDDSACLTVDIYGGITMRDLRDMAETFGDDDIWIDAVGDDKIELLITYEVSH